MMKMKSITDWGMVVGVALMSFGANLSRELAESWGIDRRILLGGLVALVAIALVRYLKFTLVLVVAILRSVPTCLQASLPSSVLTETS